MALVSLVTTFNLEVLFCKNMDVLAPKILFSMNFELSPQYSLLQASCMQDAYTEMTCIKWLAITSSVCMGVTTSFFWEKLLR